MIETVPNPARGAKRVVLGAAAPDAIVDADRMHPSETLLSRLGPRGLVFGALVLAGCFVGDAADGLPCEKDADCGIGVACQEDPATSTLCCGGSCLIGGSSSGSTTTVGSTTDGTSSSSTRGSSSGESSSTTGPLCGNGMLDPGEECDKELPDPCSDDCTLCGNGVLDAGELCDPVLHGEGCEACMELTLLSWDAQSPAAQAEADFVFPVWMGPMDPLVWRRSNTTGELVSGPYLDPTSNPAVNLDPDGGWPQSRLLTRALTFPALEPTDVVEVRVNHHYAFASTEENAYDHGRVDFVSDASVTPETWLPLLPGATDASGVTCVGEPGPPMIPGPSTECFQFAEAPSVPFCDGGHTEWIAAQADSATATIDVDPADVGGRTLQLSFRLRYDCLNPTLSENTGEDDAWGVAEVLVMVTRPPRRP